MKQLEEQYKKFWIDNFHTYVIESKLSNLSIFEKSFRTSGSYSFKIVLVFIEKLLRKSVNTYKKFMLTQKSSKPPMFR